ncbi:unnamed protein product, partial [Closterium sp. NIES-64]
MVPILELAEAKVCSCSVNDRVGVFDASVSSALDSKVLSPYCRHMRSTFFPPFLHFFPSLPSPPFRPFPLFPPVPPFPPFPPFPTSPPSVLSRFSAVDVAAAAPRLASLIFQTLPIYSDRRSQASVERAITKALKRETAFVKAFAGALVQACAKPGSVSASVAGLVRYKLLKWSCLLLRERGDAIVGVRAAFSRLVVAQGTLLTVALGDEPRLKRASLHAVNEMLGV